MRGFANFLRGSAGLLASLFLSGLAGRGLVCVWGLWGSGDVCLIVLVAMSVCFVPFRILCFMLSVC